MLSTSQVARQSCHRLFPTPSVTGCSKNLRSFKGFSTLSTPSSTTFNSSESSLRSESNANIHTGSKVTPSITPTLSPEEALYLAKQAGFYTKKELQEQIIRSPSFSSSKSPLLLDQFLKPLATEEEDIAASVAEEKALQEKISADETAKNSAWDPQGTMIPQKVHDTLNRLAKARQSQNGHPITSFRDLVTGFEWLSRASGVGTRARATAKVVLVRGSGRIKVNGEEDFCHRWPLFYNRLEIILPFEVTHSAGLFDVYISVKGGGPSGQSGAAKLAIARALYEARPSCLAELEARELLFEDNRQHLSKEPGQKGPRAKYRWNKR